MTKKINVQHDVYDKNYFDNMVKGLPYVKSEHWEKFFDDIAEKIKNEINPKTVLDVGCAKGFLVEKLRKRGIEAYGIDISEYAISEVDESIKDYCKVGSILEKFDRKYDLIICIEVVEHLFEEDSKTAIDNLCEHSDEIIFSSSPIDFEEKTHHNVRDPSYWGELFAKNGFFRDITFDANFITLWAGRFKKNIKPREEIIGSYENKLWELNIEKQEILKNISNFQYIEKSLDQPLIKLLQIYQQRKDLQEHYPEVKHGEIFGLVEWARNFGVNENRESLGKHENAFNEIFNKLRISKDIKIKELELGEVIQRRDAEVSELRKKELELGEVIQRRDAEVSELRKKELELGEVIQRKNNEVFWLKNEVERVEKENSGFRNTVMELQSSVSKVENQLNIILNTKSYKITRSIQNLIDTKILKNRLLGPLAKKIILQNQFIEDNNEVIDRRDLGYFFDDYVSKNELSNILFFNHLPKISIIMPVYKTNPKLLEKAINSVKNQYYDNWQLCICDDGSNDIKIKEILKEFTEDRRIKVFFSTENRGISVASNNALSLTDGQYVVLLDHDDELAKNALYEIVKAINNNPNVDFIYSDEDKIDKKGNHVEPFFKPDWSPDLLFSYNYPIHVSVFKTHILREVGGFREGFEGSQDYDLILRYIEKSKNIFHIPKVLYSWRKISGSTALDIDEKSYAFEAGKRALTETLIRRKIKATCENGVQRGTYRIKYNILENPLISILIPSKTFQNIKVCIESIFEKSTYRNFEIIVLDTSNNDQISEYCKNKKINTLKFNLEKFNFSKINNDGVKASKGEYIIFLNDDTRVISKDWIECLLEHSQRDEVGITGSKLIYDNKRVQHAGTVIGINGLAGNYGQMDMNEGGYFSFAKIIRNCSAVTAGCMMIEKKLFVGLGEFDEKLANSWQDVDLCLRVLEYGKLIVYTPYSMLYHYEGKTRGRNDSSEEEQTARKLFVRIHRKVIELGDKYYNPHLSLTTPFEIKTELNKPLQVLADLYLKREDLRKEFRNDIYHGFKSMIDWASTHGVISDGDKDLLLIHYDYYYQYCSEPARPLADKMKLFLDTTDYQTRFPEVYEGKYENFLNFLEQIEIATR